MTVYTVHHVDGIAMTDDPPAPKSEAEQQFERAAMIEQQVRALIGTVAAAELILRGGKLDA